MRKQYDDTFSPFFASLGIVEKDAERKKNSKTPRVKNYLEFASEYFRTYNYIL